MNGSTGLEETRALASRMSNEDLIKVVEAVDVFMQSMVTIDFLFGTHPLIKLAVGELAATIGDLLPPEEA